MQEISMNIWALLGCVVIRMAAGALWFSPLLFLKAWQKMNGIKDKQLQAGMVKGIVTDAFTSLLMAFVLMHAIKYAISGSHDVALGLGVSFMNWLGLVATVQIGIVTYEHKPFKYFLIVSGYQLVTILLMGVVLTLWG
jgi:hypothetical protein